ncbi:MAG: hypothetical protein AAGJ68_04910 [Pseudomonadota bacterium]
MKVLFLAAGLIPLSTVAAHASEVPAVTIDMFESLAGDDWSGSLTYLNYQAPFEDVTIPANIEISLLNSGLKLDYKYPNEPHANSSAVASISENGTVFMNEPVIANTLTDDDVREIKTGFACEDMGRSAQCEMTYMFSSSTLQITKMVTYDGEIEAFRRNAYTFQR